MRHDTPLCRATDTQLSTNHSITRESPQTPFYAMLLSPVVNRLEARNTEWPGLLPSQGVSNHTFHHVSTPLLSHSPDNGQTTVVGSLVIEGAAVNILGLLVSRHNSFT